MGEANKRGTYAERKAKAISRDKALAASRVIIEPTHSRNQSRVSHALLAGLLGAAILPPKER